MISTFEDWFTENCSPSQIVTFAQYGRYIQGWRNSMPWAYKNMSLAYDAWAEKNWEKYPYKQQLIDSWKRALARHAKAVIETHDKKVLKESVQETADFELTVFGTLIAWVNLVGQKPRRAV